MLAILSVLLLAVTLLFGLRIGDYNARYQQLVSAERARRGQPTAAGSAELQRQQDELDRLYADLELPRRRATRHILIAIVASLVAVLVNSISVTYFIGTSRWCKEVVDAYQLDPELAVRSASLKRRTFPWSLMGILIVLLVVALGAASDPGTLRPTTGRWVLPHLCAALCGVTIIAISFMLQVHNIRSNMEIVDRILGQVREIRLSRGLDVEQ